MGVFREHSFGKRAAVGLSLYLLSNKLKHG